VRAGVGGAGARRRAGRHPGGAVPAGLRRAPGGAARHRRSAGGLLRDFALRYRDRFGVPAVPVHDALAVAAVSHPGLLGWEEGTASVECSGELTRGALVADLRTPDRERRVSIARTVDADAFAALLTDRLAGYAGGARRR